MKNSIKLLLIFIVLFLSIQVPPAAAQSPNLTITKTNNVGGSAALNSTWRWTVTVTNAGPGNVIFGANQVIVTDNFPNVPGLTYTNFTPIFSGGIGLPSCNFAALTGTCTSGGGSYTITPGGTVGFSVDVTSTAMGSFTNPDAAGSCQADPNNVITESNEGDNTCTDTVNVVGPPNLIVTKTNDVGGQITLGSGSWFWDMTIQNTGTSAAAFSNGQTIFTDNLPNVGISYLNSGAINLVGVTGTIFCNLFTVNVVCTANGAVTINAGGSFTARVQATPSIAGAFTNPRGGGACAVDPNSLVTETNEGDNTCTDTVNVVAPDLTVTKTNDVGGTVVFGNSYTWTLNVANTGGADAVFNNGDTILIDNLPNTGATYGAPTVANAVGITNPGNIACSIAGSDLTCTASGGSVTMANTTGAFDVQVNVTPTVIQPLGNPRAGGACVVDPNNAVTPESDENNNTCGDTVNVIAPDLTVTKTNDVGGTVVFGNSYTWTLNVANTDAADAVFNDGDTILIDNLPNTGATYGAPTVANTVGITNPGNIACGIAGSDLTCTASGGSVTIGNTTGAFDVQVNVTPTIIQPLGNPRTGGVCVVDPNDVVLESDENNNTCGDTVNVIAPDLTVIKTNDTGGSILINNSFTWSLTVNNVGIADAVFTNGSTILSDDLPAGPTYGAVTVANVAGVTNAANLVCNIAGTLLSCTANGADVTLAAGSGTFEVQIPTTPTATGTLNNPPLNGQCAVDPNDAIPESDENNTCSNQVRVRPRPTQTTTSSEEGGGIQIFDPAISKLGFLQFGELGVTGEQIEWVVTVVNNGGTTANNVVVTDTLRPELRFDRVEGDVQAAVDGQTVRVTIPVLEPGDVVIFSIFTTVLEGGASVDNVACVTGANGEVCASASAVSALPQTGETPPWRTPVLVVMVTLMVMSIVGAGLFVTNRRAP